MPYIADNIAVNEQQAYAYWFENLKKVRKFAAENIRNAKEIQKQNYDKHARSHSFNVGDYVYIKIEKWNEDDDTKLKNFYKGRYKIVKFLSDTNVILSDEKEKQLPRSVYINKLKKRKIRKEIPIPESNIEKNSDLNRTRESIERDMDYESDSSDSNTIIYENQSQQSDISDNKLDHSSNDEITEYSDTFNHTMTNILWRECTRFTENEYLLTERYNTMLVTKTTQLRKTEFGLTKKI